MKKIFLSIISITIIIFFCLIFHKYIRNEKEIIFIPNQFKFVETKEYIYNRQERLDIEKEKIIYNAYKREANPGDKKITRKEAIYDLDILMYILRTRYPYYDKFGGDKKFLEIKENILNEISKNDEIDALDFAKIIRDNLKIVKDSHFYISGSSNVPENQYYYIYDKYIDNKTVEKISPEYKEKYLKYTLDKNGNIKYTLVAISNINEKSINLQLKLINGEVLNYTLLQMNINDFKYNPKEFEETDNYYLIRSKSFKNKSKNHYKKYADKMKDKDLIIDFRGNGGGFVPIFDDILNKYYTNMDESRKIMVNYILENDLKWTKIDGQSIINSINKKNNNKIYILVSKDTYSAPEVISIALKLIDYKNVIIVGVRTSGAIITDIYDWVLPNSDIPINVGRVYSKEIDKAKEYEGIEPDIWIDANDEKIIEKLDKFIKKNK